MPMSILPIIIIFLLGCTEQDSSIIRVEKNAIFLGNKKIANTADVASQDSLLVEALHKAFESKKDTSKSCQIKIDPELSYGVLYKIANTCKLSGYADFGIVYKIDGEDYDLPFFMDAPCDTYYGVGERYMAIAVEIEENSFEFWLRYGGYSSRKFNNKNLDSAYNEITEFLIRFSNNLHKNEGAGYRRIVIVSNINAKVSHAISIMHKLKETGFNQIHLQPGYTKPYVWPKEGFKKIFKYKIAWENGDCQLE
jgi:biopolymer transport protein ExbD